MLPSMKPMKLLRTGTPKILKDIFDFLPTHDQKALSSTSTQLFDVFRNVWLGRRRECINAALKDAADVQAFSHLMANPALGQFQTLLLCLHCDLGREFAVDPESNVHEMRCNFMASFCASYGETLRKLSAAFPGVTRLYAERRGTEPLAESEADLSLSWNLKKLHVRDLPISLFTGCSSTLTQLVYQMVYAERNDAMYRIPSALFDACKNTVELMEVYVFPGSSFEVCDMNDVAKLTKVRVLLSSGGAMVGNLDMSRMPPTLISLYNGDQRLI